MQRCEKCLHAFPWIQLYKSIWLSSEKVSITCKLCDTKHQLQRSSTAILYITMIPVIIFTFYL